MIFWAQKLVEGCKAIPENFLSPTEYLATDSETKNTAIAAYLSEVKPHMIYPALTVGLAALPLVLFRWKRPGAVIFTLLLITASIFATTRPLNGLGHSLSHTILHECSNRAETLHQGLVILPALLGLAIVLIGHFRKWIDPANWPARFVHTTQILLWIYSMTAAYLSIAMGLTDRPHFPEPHYFPLFLLGILALAFMRSPHSRQIILVLTLVFLSATAIIQGCSWGL